MNEENIVIEPCASPHDPVLGSHVGIQIKHKLSGIVVKSLDKKSQFENKKVAIEMLKFELVKERFLDIDENELVVGDLFFKELDQP